MENKKIKPIKFDNDSYTLIQVEATTQFKNIFTGEIETRVGLTWVEAKEDIELGSIANPNKQIKQIQIISPKKKWK